MTSFADEAYELRNEKGTIQVNLCVLHPADIQEVMYFVSGRKLSIRYRSSARVFRSIQEHSEPLNRSVGGPLRYFIGSEYSECLGVCGHPLWSFMSG